MAAGWEGQWVARTAAEWVGEWGATSAASMAAMTAFETAVLKAGFAVVGTVVLMVSWTAVHWADESAYQKAYYSGRQTVVMLALRKVGQTEMK